MTTQRYATVDANGRVTGFYASDTHPVIPAGAVAITQDEWLQWIQATQTLAWQNGALVTVGPPAPPVVQQQPAIRAQLAELDMSIPRGLEDMWAASGFDITKLPTATQTKLAQKGTLRTQLAALIAAGTP